MKLVPLLGVPFVLTLAAQSFATVMVLPVKGTNLEPGEVDAIGQMITGSVQTEAKEATVGPVDAQKAVDETGGYPQAAKKLGAKEYVYVTAVKLNARIVLTATRYDADGHYIYSAKMSATTLDDIEPASDRLAKALLHQQTTTEVRNVDNVTQTEGTKPNRVTAQKVAGFKGSFTYPIGWGEKIAPQMSGAFDLRLESGMHFIEIGVGLTFPTSTVSNKYGGIWADIGGSFYLTNDNTAPYLGFGVMPRLMGSDGSSLANLAAYAQGGLMMFRESSTRFYTDVRIAQNLLPVTFGSDETYDPNTFQTVRTNGTDLYPTELTFSVGMGF
jgi:hypothetical protein